VPWFFTAAPAIVRGRGERIELLPPIPSLAAVVACPREPLSTAAVYSEWSRGPGTGGDSDPVRLADALTAGRLRHARPLLVNDLEAPAGRLCPEIERLLMALRRAGALAPRLTGSGSACFALTRTAAEARAIAARLAAERGSDGSRRWPTAVATWVIGTPRA
jgi:4-diphosphocytidyl-2-C-methyl-D-erythritol kinase